jgi:shikimate dehydrogenase
VSFALVQNKASSLFIANRTLERAETLADNLKRYIRDSSRRSGGLKTEIAALPWQSLTSRGTFDHCHLIVNCTTMGMKHSSQEGQSPLSIEVIPRGILVYDLLYNPSPTPLLQVAQRAGANILGGLAMLIYQGAVSFELWTERKAPLDIMFSKARKILMGGEE